MKKEDDIVKMKVRMGRIAMINPYKRTFPECGQCKDFICDSGRCINVEWIKQKLYKLNWDRLAMGRTFTMTFIKGESVDIKDGYYIFVLHGTPPKGVAIYQLYHQFLICINHNGKTIHYKRVKIRDLEGKNCIVNESTELKRLMEEANKL